ncbi:MAG: LamG-like jellyroll fold domain-containing protein, partial [Candidatus Brocadia sp.]
TTGKIGGGLSFDGVNDYVAIPRMNHDEVSICAWFFKHANDTTRADGIFGGYRANSNVQLREGFDVRFSPGTPDTLEFVVVSQDGGGNKTTRTVSHSLGNSVGSWYHVVGTYNKASGEQKLYVNGQHVDTQTHPAGNTTCHWPIFPKCG